MGTNLVCELGGPEQSTKVHYEDKRALDSVASLSSLPDLDRLDPNQLELCP